jgi:DNA-binding GntR family transcriptional regulator
MEYVNNGRFDIIMELVDQVRAEILSMPNADSSIRELDLCKKFNVSRTSIRDVLKQLEVEKLIERRKNKGTSLRRFSLKEIADTYDLRAVLEGFAGNLAAQKITAEELVELRRIAALYRQNENENADPKLRAELDDRFHWMIINIADNEQLKDMMRQFAILKQAFSLYMKKENKLRPIQHTPFPHDKIVDAIEDQDGAKAELLLRKHSLWAKQHLLERFTGVRVETM